MLLLLRATRPAFLTITVLAYGLGLALARARGLPLDPAAAAAGLLAALLAHAAANVLNDYYDALSGADAGNTGRIGPYTGGSRLIQEGRLSTAATARLGWALLAAAAVLGLWLTARVGPGLLAFGVVGLGLAWAYSAPPLALMTRGLGELSIALSWLLVVAGADYLQRRGWALQPLAAGVSYALLVAAILWINQFPDAHADAAAGKRTLVVRLGPQQACWAFIGLVLAAELATVLAVDAGVLAPRCMLALLSFIPLSKAARELLAHAGEPAALRSAIVATLAGAHVHGALLILGLLWEGSPWR